MAEPARLPSFHTCVGTGQPRHLPKWYKENGKLLPDEISESILLETSREFLSETLCSSIDPLTEFLHYAAHELYEHHRYRVDFEHKGRESEFECEDTSY